MAQLPEQIDSFIGYLLKRAQGALRTRMEELLRPVGLTVAQYSCLEAIAGHPGASNAEIARRVFVTRQTMNTLLRALQQRGLVARAERAEQGRALPTELTPEGARLVVTARAIVEQIERDIVEALDAEQLRMMPAALGQISAALEGRAGER